jgi:hypothetical protein
MLEDLQARRDGFVVLVKLAFFRGSALSFPTESTVVIKRIVLVPGGVALIVLMTIVVVDCRTLVPVNEAGQPLEAFRRADREMTAPRKPTSPAAGPGQSA